LLKAHRLFKESKEEVSELENSQTDELAYRLFMDARAYLRAARMGGDNYYFILSEFSCDANVYTSLQRSFVVTCAYLAMRFVNCSWHGHKAVQMYSAVVCIEARMVQGNSLLVWQFAVCSRRRCCYCHSAQGRMQLQ